MTMIERPSPNHDARPEGAAITVLVLHYTDMPSAGDALQRLCDPGAEVSAHYLIDEDGTTYRLVEEARRAWHAGRSRWRGIEGINAVSIGIELQNPGHSHGYRPFPAVQMAALAGLASGILARQPIPPRNVVGHSDIAPERKLDPGELFDWPGLAARGVGLWPDPAADHDIAPLREGDQGPRVAGLHAALARYGYGLGPGDRFDPSTTAVVQAFQRHFRPDRIDGVWDGACAARLARLLALAGD
ncbi:MAG: N-acetylmuramoyl-L-alanine amidase [Alphaproteobacteria bacterium]